MRGAPHRQSVRVVTAGGAGPTRRGRRLAGAIGRRRRRVATAFGAILLSALLGACGPRATGPGVRSASLVLDFTPNAIHAGIYEAIARGYDRRRRRRTARDRAVGEHGRDQAAADRPRRLRDPRHPRSRDRPRATGRTSSGSWRSSQRPLASVIAAPRFASPRRSTASSWASPATRATWRCCARSWPAPAVDPQRYARSRSASTRSPTCSRGGWRQPRRSGTTRA